MILHVIPSSYRVHLSPCEVWVLKAPLELGDGRHESVRGPSDVFASDHVAGPLLGHALGAECQDGQQQAPCALSVPEAELVQPRWAGGSAVKSQACSGSGESPLAGTVPSQCPAPLSKMCLRPSPLGFASQGPRPGPLSVLCG